MIRLDKWLWAARFYKTRQIAKKAIEKPNVKLNGNKSKPHKNIKTGDILDIIQPHATKTVVVKKLDDKRKSATESQLMYIETPESILKREEIALLTKQNNISTSHRPNKKERRDLMKLKNF